MTKEEITTLTKSLVLQQEEIAILLDSLHFFAHKIEDTLLDGDTAYLMDRELSERLRERKGAAYRLSKRIGEVPYEKKTQPKLDLRGSR